MASLHKGRIAQWGTSVGSDLGVVTSYEDVSDVMTQSETDESGSVCRVVKYDTRRRVVLGLQASARARVPEVGINFSVGNMRGWVQHVEVIEQNTAFKKMRVTVEAYEKCNQIG